MSPCMPVLDILSPTDLRIELRISPVLAKHFATELQLQALWPILKNKIKPVLPRPLVNFQIPPSSEFSREDAEKQIRVRRLMPARLPVRPVLICLAVQP